MALAHHPGILWHVTWLTSWLSSQVLTCTQEMMQLRVDFLRDQGLGQEALGRAVLAHPQV